MRKYWPVFIITFALTLVISFLAVDKTSYSRFVENHIVREARNSGVLLAFENSNLHWVGMSSSQLGITILNFPLAFTLKNPRVDIDASSLLSSSQTFQVLAELYSGKLNTTLTNGSNNTLSGILTLDKANIAENLFLAGWGFTKGQLSLDVQDFSVEQGELSKLKTSLSIEKASKPRTTLMPARITGLPLDFSIPPIDDINLQANCSHEGNALKITDIQLESSFGSVTGNLTLVLDQAGRPRAIDSEAKFSLTDEGSSQIGSYLPLLSAGAIKKKAKNFKIRAKGALPQPHIHFESL